MALNAESKEFIAHNSVQKILDNIWNGKITQKNSNLLYVNMI